MKTKNSFAILFIALFFALLAPQAQAYTDHSLTVKILLREDGSAHVTEQTIFSSDTPQEVADSNRLLSSARSVAQLAQLSENVKFHVANATVSRSNIRITTKPEYELGNTARSIILDYDVGPIAYNKTNGRLTTYYFTQDALEFEKATSKQMVLGPIMELSIEIPKNTKISLSPEDGKPLIGPLPFETSENTITWSGKNIGQMVGFWFLQYDFEQPLSSEVYNYFQQKYQAIASIAPLAILAILALAVILILVKIRKK